MEKYDKDWEDECLPRGPKAPLSPHLAVEEGHALCWPDPEEMKATWLLSQPSRCSEYRGSLLVKWLGFSTQTLRLLSGASQRDQVPTTGFLSLGGGKYRVSQDPAGPCLHSANMAKHLCSEARSGAQRVSLAEMEMGNCLAQEKGRGDVGRNNFVRLLQSN